MQCTAAPRPRVCGKKIYFKYFLISVETIIYFYSNFLVNIPPTLYKINNCQQWTSESVSGSLCLPWLEYISQGVSFNLTKKAWMKNLHISVICGTIADSGVGGLLIPMYHKLLFIFVCEFQSPCHVHEAYKSSNTWDNQGVEQHVWNDRCFSKST